MKVGFLLGSFDPIHMGHLHMAAASLNTGLVDKVVFVPSVQNPWKENSTDFRNRCFMIQLAIDDMEHCSLSSIDYRNTAPYYSVNTLKMLQEEYPEDELYLIVGADIVNNIKDWHEGEWILKNFDFTAGNEIPFTEFEKMPCISIDYALMEKSKNKSNCEL